MDILDSLVKSIEKEATRRALLYLNNKYSNVSFTFDVHNNDLRTVINGCCEKACWGFINDFNNTLDNIKANIINNLLAEKGND